MQPAVVVEPGPVATVMISREPMCGNCGLCTPATGKRHLVRAVDRVGARRGQRVMLEFPASAFLRASALAFGLPLAGLLTGMAVGQRMVGPPGAALAGMAGLGLAYGLLHWIDRVPRFREIPVIVATCQHED